MNTLIQVTSNYFTVKDSKDFEDTMNRLGIDYQKKLTKEVINNMTISLYTRHSKIQEKLISKMIVKDGLVRPDPLYCYRILFEDNDLYTVSDNPDMGDDFDIIEYLKEVLLDGNFACFQTVVTDYNLNTACPYIEFITFNKHFTHQVFGVIDLLADQNVLPSSYISEEYGIYNNIYNFMMF